MANIIKATSGRERPLTFQLADISRDAQAYLDAVRAEAESLIDEARREAERLRLAATTPPAGDEDSADGSARLAGPLAALEAAVDQIHTARLEHLSRWEHQILRLACGIAERILRAELTRRPDIPLALVQEALELAAGEPRVVVQLNPADYETLRAELQRQVAKRATPLKVELAPHAEITPGGCRVLTRHGEIDQRLESQLARIEEELAD